MEEIRVSPTETLETPRDELTTGSTFAGRYQIIEELGKGGMGRVYRVLDKKLKEEVVLKLIKPEIGLDKKTIERFSNELKLSRKIVHKNVARMFDLNEEKGTHYITMEYVRGEDLRRLIRKMGILSLGQAIPIAKQVCEGLAEAHRLGVVHRDLKPGNIMIDEEGKARIMDFGIARSLKERGITGEGVIIGTPEYMSPEQVEGKEVDQRSDVYSLGVILYEMVTGRVPFSGDTPLSVAVKQKTEAPQDPSKLNAQVPESLGRVILKCLEKAKEKRYQSAEELHSDLTRIEEEIPTAERAIPERKPTKLREIAVGNGRIKWVKIGFYAGAVVILALIVYAGLHLFSGRHEVIDSIAVLPFENVNADPNTNYLCDGITETIINKLSQLPSLKKVIARDSVFTYRGKTVEPKKVGQELDVKAVLLTRLVRVGDMLTISPTLVRTRDNNQLWGERYNRKFDDIFAIEEEMSTSIIQALRLKISAEEKQKLSQRPIDNAAAYDYYLKAEGEIFSYKKDAIDRGVQYLQNGIDLIGDNALFYAGLADAYYAYANLGYKREDYVVKAEEFVNKALSLDPQLPDALITQGTIYCDLRGNPREAIRCYKRALAASPNGSAGLGKLAYCYGFLGRASKSHELIEKLKQIDPIASHIWEEGMIYWFEGQYELALEQWRKLFQSDPKDSFSRYCLTWCLINNDKFEEALSINEGIVKADPNDTFTNVVLLFKCVILKDEKNAYQLMTPEFLKGCKMDPVGSYQIVTAFALLDKRDEAMDWLENAVNCGYLNYPVLAEKDPVLKNLRGEPRFKKLMERVKYEWEHFEE